LLSDAQKGREKRQMLSFVRRNKEIKKAFLLTSSSLSCEKKHTFPPSLSSSLFFSKKERKEGTSGGWALDGWLKRGEGKRGKGTAIMDLRRALPL